MINRAARERDGVKDDDAGGAQRLRERGEIFARHHHAADEQAKAGKKADGHAQFGRDEVVVERVFDEERDAEEQRKAADPRETFHAHELFPVDFWRGLEAAARKCAPVSAAQLLSESAAARRRAEVAAKRRVAARRLVVAATTGDGVMISGCGAGAGAGLTGFGGSFSRFSRNISDSRATSRSESSSMRFLALMARTISQIASAIGTPRITKTTRYDAGFHKFYFSGERLVARSVRPAAGSWQAAKSGRALAAKSG